MNPGQTKEFLDNVFGFKTFSIVYGYAYDFAKYLYSKLLKK